MDIMVLVGKLITTASACSGKFENPYAFFLKIMGTQVNPLYRQEQSVLVKTKNLRFAGRIPDLREHPDKK